MSTSSSEDFAGFDGEHFIFEKIEPGYEGDGVALLEYRNRWFLGCRYGGCSCHFRVLPCESPPESSDPEEDPEDIDATRAFYDLVSKLVGEDHQVDIVTIWEGDEPFDTIGSRDVSLTQVSRDVFGFIEGYRFRFVP